jgi:hypothetical protein
LLNLNLHDELAVTSISGIEVKLTEKVYSRGCTALAHLRLTG